MALALARWFDPLLDLVFPAVCPVCATRSDSAAHRPFCAPCWTALPIGLRPGCPTCGAPFPGLAGALPCDACRRAPPPYAFARAVAQYRDGMREAIHALKYGGRPVLATPLGRLLAGTAPGVLPAPPADWAEGLVPVPLHAARLAERGFNQAELLAAPCAARWRLPILGACPGPHPPDAPADRSRRRGPAGQRPRCVRGPPPGRRSRAGGSCWWTMSSRRAPPSAPRRGLSGRRAPQPSAW